MDIRGAPAPSATGIVRVEPTNAALVGTRAARNGTRDRGAKEAAVAASERLLTAKRVREEKALAVANAAARISAPAWVLKRGRFMLLEGRLEPGLARRIFRQDCFGRSSCESHVANSGTRSTRASIATDGVVADTTWLYTGR